MTKSDEEIRGKAAEVVAAAKKRLLKDRLATVTGPSAVANMTMNLAIAEGERLFDGLDSAFDFFLRPAPSTFDGLKSDFSGILKNRYAIQNPDAEGDALSTVNAEWEQSLHDVRLIIDRSEGRAFEAFGDNFIPYYQKINATHARIVRVLYEVPKSMKALYEKAREDVFAVAEKTIEVLDGTGKTGDELSKLSFAAGVAGFKSGPVGAVFGVISLALSGAALWVGNEPDPDPHLQEVRHASIQGDTAEKIVDSMRSALNAIVANMTEFERQLADNLNRLSGGIQQEVKSTDTRVDKRVVAPVPWS